MDSDEMNELLASSPEGPGQGRFTLDPGRALEILSSHQLADPRDYIVKLVQWAVASRPRAIHVALGPEEIWVEHDGRAISAELATVGDLVGAGEHHLNYLVYGLAAEKKVGATRIQLDSQEKSWTLLEDGTHMKAPAGGGTRVTIRRRAAPPEATWGFALKFIVSMSLLGVPFGWREGHVWQAMGCGTIVGLFGMRGLISDLVREGGRLNCHERDLLRKACDLAAVPIYVDNQPINQPVFNSPARYRVVPEGLDATTSLWNQRGRGRPHCWLVEEGGELLGPTSAAGLWMASWGTGRRWSDLAAQAAGLEAGLIRVDGKPTVPCRAIMFHQPCTRQNDSIPLGGLLRWVKDGAIMVEETQSGGMNQANVVASAHDLEVDMSQGKFVRNAHYEEVLAGIRKASAALEYWSQQVQRQT